MNEQALNDARERQRELDAAKAVLAKDSKSQTFWGVALLLVMLTSCLGFVGGALWISNKIGVQFKVYMDGTFDEEDQ